MNESPTWTGEGNPTIGYMTKEEHEASPPPFPPEVGYDEESGQ